MKKMFLFLLFFTSATLVCNAQDTPEKKTALENSNFILSKPYVKEDPKTAQTVQSLVKWMTDTPDFSFALDADIMEKIVGEDSNLLMIYMACMAKYCLENEGNSKDAKLVKLNAIKLIIAYSEKPENNVKMSKPFKKLAAANKKGTLETELN